MSNAPLKCNTCNNGESTLSIYQRQNRAVLYADRGRLMDSRSYASRWGTLHLCKTYSRLCIRKWEERRTQSSKPLDDDDQKYKWVKKTKDWWVQEVFRGKAANQEKLEKKDDDDELNNWKQYRILIQMNAQKALKHFIELIEGRHSTKTVENLLTVAEQPVTSSYY